MDEASSTHGRRLVDAWTKARPCIDGKTTLFFTLSTTALGATRKVRVSCIGNSITYGMGLDNPQRDSSTAEHPGRRRPPRLHLQELSSCPIP